MAKLDSYPQPPRAQGRTAHDMSHDFKFTANCGQLLPVEHDWLIPGDTAYLKFHFFGRNLLDFLAPAMCDIDFHVDYFFVPAMLIYSPFGSFERGVKDEYSSFFLARDTSTAQRLGHLTIKLPILDMREVNDYFWRDARSYVYHLSDPDTGQLGAAITGEQLQYEALGRQYVRLMDMLGFNGQLQDTVGYNPNVFPYALCAYQCIYEKYFRLEDREDYSPIFNLDRYQNVASSGGLIHLYSNPQMVNQQQHLKNLFRLRYRPANFDYFNSVKKSPLLNDQNLNYNQYLSLENIPQFKDAPSYFGDLFTYPSSSGGFVGSSLESQTYIGNDGSLNNLFTSGPINDGMNGLSQLRQLFAVDKVAQVTARARKSYDAQVLAHFGYKVPHDVKHDLTHIAHESATMNIGQVISTGSVEDLGARAGNGVVSHESKGIKFTAPCHGCLMVIFSSSVRYDYQVPFLRKNFIQSRLDFWQPEFDHLGMQPTYLFETSYLSFHDVGPIPNEYAFAVQGWTYRYSEKKRNINRVSLAFGHDPWPQSDLSQTLSSYAPWQRPYHGVTFGHYVNPETGQSEQGNFQYASDEFAFLSRPSDLDGIFSAIYDTSFPADMPANIGDLFVRDQFIIASRVQYTKVSEMSAYSMPKLD